MREQTIDLLHKKQNYTFLPINIYNAKHIGQKKKLFWDIRFGIARIVSNAEQWTMWLNKFGCRVILAH